MNTKSDAPHNDEWMQAEIDRLLTEPCLCEPCKCRSGCDDCDGLGVTTSCERCEQINELGISQGYARREIHGHFGSGPHER